MYKHLTPQEIEEFEKLYVSWIVYEPKFSGEMLGEAGLKLKKDALSFIDTLMGKRVGEAEKLLKECEPFLSDHSGFGIINSVYIPPAQVMRNAADRMEYEQNLKKRVKDFLSPDSPKRNEEDL